MSEWLSPGMSRLILIVACLGITAWLTWEKVLPASFASGIIGTVLTAALAGAFSNQGAAQATVAAKVGADSVTNGSAAPPGTSAAIQSKKP